MHKRALRALLGDYESTFESLLTKNNEIAIHTKNLQKLIAALAALYIDAISLSLSFCRFVVKSIQCQSRLQSEFVVLPLLWDLRGNSARSQPRTVLRVVNGFGVSKFDVKQHTLPILIIICNLFPTFEE